MSYCPASSPCFRVVDPTESDEKGVHPIQISLSLLPTKMDTVPEESIVEANSVDIEANSLLTQSTAASGPRPSKDSRASIERLAAIRSTTIDSYRSEPSPTRRIADPETIQKVEAVVDKIIRGFKDQDESISIVLKTKPRSSITTSLSSQAPSPRTQYQLSFPGNTPQEAWRFSTAELAKTVRRRTAAMLTCHPAVVLRILELIHEALVNNVVVSKRYIPTRFWTSCSLVGWFLLNFDLCSNIYYKDPELFKSQKVVDRYVDILSYTFGIQRQALNVVSPPASSIVYDDMNLPGLSDSHSKRTRRGKFHHYLSRRLDVFTEWTSRCTNTSSLSRNMC